MTPQELADILNGREYSEEITRDEQRAAKAAGLVVVFGASDDLVELRGAIDDEAGAYRGSTLRVDAKGLLPDWDSLDKDDIDDCRDYFQREAGAKTVTAHWDRGGYSWTYSTNIPHAVFDILEDGEKYCQGIVFRLADVE
jgi:hypothetical protein